MAYFNEPEQLRKQALADMATLSRVGPNPGRAGRNQMATQMAGLQGIVSGVNDMTAQSRQPAGRLATAATAPTALQKPIWELTSALTDQTQASTALAGDAAFRRGPVGADLPTAPDPTGSSGFLRLAKGTAKVRGPKGRDKVPAMLTEGEAVLTPGAAKALGRENIAALNAKHPPKTPATPRAPKGMNNTQKSFRDKSLRNAKVQHFAFGEEQVLDPINAANRELERVRGLQATDAARAADRAAAAQAQQAFQPNAQRAQAAAQQNVQRMIQESRAERAFTPNPQRAAATFVGPQDNPTARLPHNAAEVAAREARALHAMNNPPGLDPDRFKAPAPPTSTLPPPEATAKPGSLMAAQEKLMAQGTPVKDIVNPARPIPAAPAAAPAAPAAAPAAAPIAPEIATPAAGPKAEPQTFTERAKAAYGKYAPQFLGGDPAAPKVPGAAPTVSEQLAALEGKVKEAKTPAEARAAAESLERARMAETARAAAVQAEKEALSRAAAQGTHRAQLAGSWPTLGNAIASTEEVGSKAYQGAKQFVKELTPEKVLKGVGKAAVPLAVGVEGVTKRDFYTDPNVPTRDKLAEAALTAAGYGGGAASGMVTGATGTLMGPWTGVGAGIVGAIAGDNYTRNKILEAAGRTQSPAEEYYGKDPAVEAARAEAAKHEQELKAKMTGATKGTFLPPGTLKAQYEGDKNAGNRTSLREAAKEQYLTNFGAGAKEAGIGNDIQNRNFERRVVARHGKATNVEDIGGGVGVTTMKDGHKLYSNVGLKNVVTSKPQQYVGEDGKMTTDWSKTKDFRVADERLKELRQTLLEEKVRGAKGLTAEQLANFETERTKNINTAAKDKRTSEDARYVADVGAKATVDAAKQAAAAKAAEAGYKHDSDSAKSIDEFGKGVYTTTKLVDGKPVEYKDPAREQRLNHFFKGAIENSDYAKLSPTQQRAMQAEVKDLFEVMERAEKAGGVTLDNPSSSDIGRANPSFADAASSRAGTPTLMKKLFGLKWAGDNDWVHVGKNQVRLHELITDENGNINDARRQLLLNMLNNQKGK